MIRQVCGKWPHHRSLNMIVQMQILAQVVPELLLSRS